jgi:hypothetical protein
MEPPHKRKAATRMNERRTDAKLPRESKATVQAQSSRKRRSAIS